MVKLSNAALTIFLPPSTFIPNGSMQQIMFHRNTKRPKAPQAEMAEDHRDTPIKITTKTTLRRMKTTMNSPLGFGTSAAGIDWRVKQSA